MVKRTVNANGSTEALEHVADSGAPCHFLHKVVTSILTNLSVTLGLVIENWGKIDGLRLTKLLITIFTNVVFQDETSVAALSLCSGKDVHGLVFSGKRSAMKSCLAAVLVFILELVFWWSFWICLRCRFLALAKVQELAVRLWNFPRSLEIVPLTPRLKRMMCHWKNDSCANNDEQRSGRESKSLDFDKRC